MLASDVVYEARVHLQDERGPPFRYTDEQLLEYVHNFQMEALRVRPDLFIGSGYTATAPALSDTLVVEDQFKAAAVYYVTGHALLREDEYSDDGRAVALIGRSTAQLRGADA